MGRFTDNLSHRLRARRTAKSVRHPRGAGVAMWCPACGKQMLVTPRGVAPSLKQQQDAVEVHARECSVRHMGAERAARQARMQRAIDQGKQRRLRSARWKRWRWWLLAGILAAALAWAQTRHLWLALLGWLRGRSG